MTWERFTGLSSFLKGIALLRAISTGSVIPRRSASGVGKKRGIWARRKAWFDCHQREDESVSQWWDCKIEISQRLRPEKDDNGGGMSAPVHAGYPQKGEKAQRRNAENQRTKTG